MVLCGFGMDDMAKTSSDVSGSTSDFQACDDGSHTDTPNTSDGGPATDAAGAAGTGTDQDSNNGGQQKVDSSIQTDDAFNFRVDMLSLHDITSDPSTDAKRRWNRDDEFWFDDGTVILIVGDAGFRVYRGLLTAVSPVLDDMLSRARAHVKSMAPDATFKHKHYRILLPRDSARDWRYVLRVLMSRGGRLRLCGETPPEQRTYEEIFAYVRLGHKYQMKDMYDQAMEYLKNHFTTSYSDFKELPSWVPDGFRSLSRAIGVVNIARLTGEHSLLPTALWTCCQLNESLVKGFTYSDGERETLGQEDLMICLRAKPRLVEATLSNFLQLAALLPSRYCKHADESSELEDGPCPMMARNLIQQMRSKDASVRLTMANPMIRLSSLYPPEVVNKLCVRCYNPLMREQEKAAKETWNLLPFMFGVSVPEWVMESIESE